MGFFSRKPNVKGMVQARDVEGLLEALQHKDAKVRLNAAFGLALVGDATLLGPYVQALNRADFSLPPDQMGDVAQLGQMGDVAAGPFVKTLRHKDPNVRWGGVLALVHMGQTVVDSLVGLLRDSDWGIRGLAIVALGRIGQPAVESLAQAVVDEDRNVRLGATMALGNIGSADALGFLRAASEDEDSDVRRVAKEMLTRSGKGAS